MGYRVLSPREAKWQPRHGLEGPFWFVDRVLYYDPQAGQYWDPTTDFYLEQDEVDMLQQQVVDILSR